MTKILNIDQIKEASDIYEVVSRSVKLKKKGANYFGLCPFHDEKTPSFTVHPGKQIFKCFGCGESGDVFEFVQKNDKITFVEAIEKLAKKFNIELKKTDMKNEIKEVFIPDSVLERCCQLLINEMEAAKIENSFVRNLFDLFGHEKVVPVLEMYGVGSVKYKGQRFTTFPYIDRQKRKTAIQCKLFDNQNKTIDKSFIHSILSKYLSETNQKKPEWLIDYENSDLKVRAWFGEHLLSLYKDIPVLITESPKNSIYLHCKYGLPDKFGKLCISSYNSTFFTAARLSTFIGRKIYILPDTSKDDSIWKMWLTQVNEFMLTVDCEVEMNKTLQSCTDEQKASGYDVADYITDELKLTKL